MDPEVIKQKSGVLSETTETRENFRDDLLVRDLRCVWTGIAPARGTGTSFHIDRALRYVQHSSCMGVISNRLPFLRPLQWLRLILDNCPQYGENMTEFTDINDIRNSLFALIQIHNEFDPRNIVILKVCHVCLPTFSLLNFSVS